MGYTHLSPLNVMFGDKVAKQENRPVELLSLSLTLSVSHEAFGSHKTFLHQENNDPPAGISS